MGFVRVSSGESNADYADYAEVKGDEGNSWLRQTEARRHLQLLSA
jgi:hypothetical protein